MASKQEYLINNLDDIVKNIDFNELIKCLNMTRFQRIFPTYQSTPLTDMVTNEDAKKQFVLYCLLTDEKQFIGLLLHTAQYKAANIIEPTTIDITDPSNLDPNKGRVTSDCPYLELDPNSDRLIKNEAHSISNEFKMSESPRGICLIINNYLTFGTFKETQRFRNIYFQLHFDVIMEMNLTANQIMQKLTDLSGNPLLANHDAFACLIISHGTDKGEIIGFDGKGLDMKDMCQIFDDKHCPNLQRKPRIFVFNCCRGDQGIDYEAPKLSQSYNQTQQSIPQLPKMIDFFICYTTLDGYAAYVDWDKGTKFGSVLCDSMVNRGWYRDMNSILIRTNNLLRDEQPFDWTQSFTNVLSFHPECPFVKELP